MKINRDAAEIAMAEKGYNKIDLARAMGVSRQVVYKYLGCDECNPKMAKRFADALGINVFELFDFKLEEEEQDTH